MAEDRFANVFTAEVKMTANGVLTFAELQFGVSLRDRLAIVIDELLFYPSATSLSEMTATADSITMALTVSDQVTDIQNLADRRVLYTKRLLRFDFGVAASGSYIVLPLKESFFPPMISLPTRIYFGMDTNGLASPADAVLRMHYRTVSITQDQQLIEILESFQLST